MCIRFSCFGGIVREALIIIEKGIISRFDTWKSMGVSSSDVGIGEIPFSEFLVLMQWSVLTVPSSWMSCFWVV